MLIMTKIYSNELKVKVVCFFLQYDFVLTQTIQQNKRVINENDIRVAL
jgi:hypothetical protein